MMMQWSHLMKSLNWKTKQSLGQSFVEIALTLPLILLVFLGMIEVGFAAHSYLVVTNASREGARFGSRGVHVPIDDIIFVVETAMEGSLELEYEGDDANTSIIITQVDIDENGNYTIYDQGIRGTLSVPSSVCEPGDSPCDPHDLEIQEFIDANLNFNASEGLCDEHDGCNSDFIVVEVIHMYESAVLSGFAREFLPSPFPISGRAIMRVLHRRAPGS
jgi:hypothetical protein